MSDNRRVYSTIRMAIKQLSPTEPKGNKARMLNTLAGMIAGIVQAKSCQLPAIARKTPDLAKADSRIKRYSRWVQNERIDYEGYYLPFVWDLLTSLAQIRELVFIIDGSEVGHHCITLMISLIYGKRALPITWLVVKGCKGHLPEQLHLDLLTQLQAILPKNCQAIFLGDGEFDGIQLQEALKSLGLQYVCRTAKNIVVCHHEHEFAFETVPLEPGERFSLPQVTPRNQGYGPVHAIAWWGEGYDAPIYLLTNLEGVDEACNWYRKRARIETFFSDQKSRGFHLDKSHLSDPHRLSRLMIAACLAYIWIIDLGVRALRDKWRKFLHRTKRCDPSLFQFGLRLLDLLLNEGRCIPVSFQLAE